MFEGLSDRLSGILSGLTRRGALTEADVTAAMREALQLSKTPEAAYLPGWCGPTD